MEEETARSGVVDIAFNGREGDDGGHAKSRGRGGRVEGKERKTKYRG